MSHTNQLCRRIQLDLIPLYPADLEASEAETVRDHAAACTACAGELAIFAAQSALFAAAREGRRAPELDLWEGVRAEIQETAPRGEVVAFPGATVTRRVRIVAAAAAVLLLGSVVAYERMTPSLSPDTGTPVAPRIANHPAPTSTGSTTGPTLAQQDKKPASPRRSRPARTFFQDEGSAPVQFAEDREVLPLDEGAEVPTQNGHRERYRSYEAEPGTRDDSRTTPKDKTKKTRKPTSEDGSLSF